MKNTSKLRKLTEEQHCSTFSQVSIMSALQKKLESRLPGEISVTSDLQMTPPLWQKVKRN